MVASPAPQLIHKSLPFEIKDATQGIIEAVFSTFNVIDADGDVVRPGAIPDGLEVPMVVGHNWSALPVGKGTIRVDRKRAVITGQYFMENQTAREAFNAAKGMGSRQEFSWGFEIIEDEPGDFEGTRVRFITKTRPFEVSQVLVGSNPVTGIRLIKGSPCPTCGQVFKDEDQAGAGERLNTDDGQASDGGSVQVDPWKEADESIASALLGELASTEGLPS